MMVCLAGLGGGGDLMLSYGLDWGCPWTRPFIKLILLKTEYMLAYEGVGDWVAMIILLGQTGVHTIVGHINHTNMFLTIFSVDTHLQPLSFLS